MSRPKSYRDLIVWQKAMALAQKIYLVTDGLPRRETYGLANQIRRAAVSIASNIAEGYGRLSDLQFRHFLGNARGSLFEMQTQLELAANLGYLDRGMERQLMESGSEVARLINGLIASLRPSSANPANNANSAHTHV